MKITAAALGAAGTIFALCTAANAARADVGGADFDWRSTIVFSNVASKGFSGDDWGSAYYRDVMSHADRKITNYSPMTNAHETNHMLNNEVRNATSPNDNTVYYQDGKAALVLEPSMSSTLIRNYVPDYVKTKSNKYQTYLVDQTASWPNVLYQFDEWGAYRTDSRVAVELDRLGKLEDAANGEICVVDGAVEFLYFASAAVTGLAEKEPAYLQSNVQFKAAFALLAEQTMESYKYAKEANKQVLLCDGEDYYQHFVTSPDNERIRSVLKTWLGAGWTARVLGF